MRSRTAAIGLTACAMLMAGKGLQAQAAAVAELTVKRIYSQPSLNGQLSRGVEWTPDGRRVSFLETKGAGKDVKTELWALDVGSGKRELIVGAEKMAALLPAEKGQGSQATGAGRRAAAQYVWAPDGNRILFMGAKTLMLLDLKSQKATALVSGNQAITDAKLSPDGKRASFVRTHNLYVVSTEGGRERQLTSGGTEEVRKGEVDWVYAEELAVKTAYWWSPDSTRIAFLEMDERQVTKYPLVDFTSYEGDAEQERYPVAGGKNPVVRVFSVEVASGKTRPMDTGAETNQYIPRVDWLRDSRKLAIERLNRAQTQLDLLVVDAESGKLSVLLSERDAYWINISDDLYFLKDGKRFLWSSERSGYRHLYLYGLDGKQIAQLTKGDWETTGMQAVDEEKGWVYFSATEATPVERNIYRVGLDGTGFMRVTQQSGMHGAQFSPDAGGFVDTYSNAMTPQQQWVMRADGSREVPLNENKVAELEQYSMNAPEFRQIRSHDGTLLNAWMIKPANFDAAKKYPALVYTYGGPHAQVVLNAWGGLNFLWHQMMAQKGFVIFALDNRGSAGRGHIFEEPIHLRFGAQEMSDQRDGVAWLKAQPFVDASRIGIWGWSYGGHMTLHAMFEDPEDFKAGFAGGPVTDWHYYDSIYTERYIGLLPENEESYQESSPIEKADQLRGKLLIAHGTGDDNVHYANTLALEDKLIEKGKYVEVLAFPGRGHGVSDPAARIILMNRVAQFFLTNLGEAH